MNLHLYAKYKANMPLCPQVYQQKYPPPLIPPRGEVNAADAFDIGSFDEEDTKGDTFCSTLPCKITF